MTNDKIGARESAPENHPLTGLALYVEARRRFDPETGKGRRQAWSDISMSCREFLTRHGRAAENVRSVIRDNHGINYRFPRDIPWKKFPHIQRPVHDYGRAYIAHCYRHDDGRIGSDPQFNIRDRHAGNWRQNVDGRKTSRKALADDLPIIEEIVVLADPWDNELVWEAVAPVFSVNPHVVVWVKTFHGDPIRVQPDEIASLERKFRAKHHLAFNYIYNMIVLGSRARFVAAQFGEDVAYETSAGYHLFHEESHDVMADPAQQFTPFSIEALRLISQQRPTAQVSYEDVDRVWKDALSRLEFMRRSDDGSVHLEWAGSGKFAPWREKVAGLNDKGGTVGDQLTDLMSLYTSGLITIVDGEVAITPNGRAFVQILGNTVTDPDLLLRWRTAEGIVASERDIPAIDRWLSSHFRALKRKVASFPPSPLTEPGLRWKIPARNRLVVRGHRIDSADLTSPQIRELTKSINENNRALGLSDQRVGFVFSEDPFDQSERPTGFWFGRPLGIVPIERGHAFQYNCNVDLSLIDKDLYLADLPSWIRGRKEVASPPSFLSIETEEHEGEFVKLPHRIPMKNGRAIVPVYFGKAVFPDLATWRSNGIIGGIEAARFRSYDRAHPADLADPIRCVERRTIEDSNEPWMTKDEQGYLVGMRIGFGVLKDRDDKELTCEALLEVDEDLWAVPETELSHDKAIAADLARTEPAIWVGIPHKLRRVASVNRTGRYFRLDLEPGDGRKPWFLSQDAFV